MVPVDRRRLREPPAFNAECRQPGMQWLRINPSARRPKDLWSPFKEKLAVGFGRLCAYLAMYEPVGTVDHFISCHSNRRLTYEWTNLRFASDWMNRTKGGFPVLDPFDVKDGWFEIHLPSLQLLTTARIPGKHRKLAETTLQRLHLRDDERVLRIRREWYRMYQEGELTLEGLRKKAPLIARAVENYHRK